MEQLKKLENLKKFQSSILQDCGNLIHNSCVFTESEKNLRIQNSFYFFFEKKDFALNNHFVLLRKIRAVDYKRGTEIAGNRGYFLKGIGVLFNFSIIRYGLDFLAKKITYVYKLLIL